MGRPRKQPPVTVLEGSQYCFDCESVLPSTYFATDKNRHNGKRISCRTCDNAARTRRKRRLTA